MCDVFEHQHIDEVFVHVHNSYLTLVYQCECADFILKYTYVCMSQCKAWCSASRITGWEPIPIPWFPLTSQAPLSSPLPLLLPTIPQFS